MLTTRLRVNTCVSALRCCGGFADNWCAWFYLPVDWSPALTTWGLTVFTKEARGKAQCGCYYVIICSVLFLNVSLFTGIFGFVPTEPIDFGMKSTLD